MKVLLTDAERKIILSKVMVLFVIRKKTLYCRITVNQIRCGNDFSIHEKVVPPKRKDKPSVGEWDSKNQCVKGNTPGAQLLNAKLEQIRTQIQALAYTFTVQNKSYSADTLKSLYLGETKMTYTLIETSEMMLDFMSKQPEDEVAKGTLIGYKTRHNNMVEYLNARGYENHEPIHFSPSLAKDFQQYMRTEHQPPKGRDMVGQPHAAKCLEYIKMVIKYAYNDEQIRFNPLQEYMIKKGQSKQTPWLSREEVSRIENIEFKMDRLQRVKDSFVFLCHTGLSYKDAKMFDATIDVVTQKGIPCIDMSRFKTGIDFFVPLTKIAWDILQRYGGIRVPIISNTKLNAYLKEVQDLCEIETKLTIRVARSTCGMILLNEMNAPMETVSKILGHKNLRTTSKYYAKVLQHKVIHDVVTKNPELYIYEKD